MKYIIICCIFYGHLKKAGIPNRPLSKIEKEYIIINSK